MASWCGGAPHPRKRNPGGFRNLAHRRGDTIGSHFVAANRIASSKPPRFTRRWRRFGDFPPDPLETTQRRWLRPPSVGFCPPGDGGAAVGRGAQIVLNHPEFSPKPPNAGKHFHTGKGKAQPAGDLNLTPQRFEIVSASPRDGPCRPRAAVSFPPGAAAFLCQDKEKRGRISLRRHRCISLRRIGANPTSTCRKPPRQWHISTAICRKPPRHAHGTLPIRPGIKIPPAAFRPQAVSLHNQEICSLPKKASAMAPGPAWVPMVLPMVYTGRLSVLPS